MLEKQKCHFYTISNEGILHLAIITTSNSVKLHNVTEVSDAIAASSDWRLHFFVILIKPPFDGDATSNARTPTSISMRQLCHH